MALNISDPGVDQQVYYSVNIAINVFFLLFLALLPGLLCVLFILALLFTKTINIKIRFILINLFAAEILYWISNAIFYAGWIIRLHYNETISCKVLYTTFLVFLVQKFTSGTLYATNIFLFIKYGEKKLKWFIIIPYIALSWIIMLIIAVLGAVFTPPDFVRYNNGICSFQVYSLLFTILTALLTAVSFIFLVIQIVMVIITFVYLYGKRHSLEGNLQIKEALAKILLYLIIVSVITFISNLVPAMSYIIRLIIPGSTIVPMTARSYLAQFIFGVTGIATPIVAIMLLKPVRSAIKMKRKNLFCKTEDKNKKMQCYRNHRCMNLLSA